MPAFTKDTAINALVHCLFEHLHVNFCGLFTKGWKWGVLEEMYTSFQVVLEGLYQLIALQKWPKISVCPHPPQLLVWFILWIITHLVVIKWYLIVILLESRWLLLWPHLSFLAIWDKTVSGLCMFVARFSLVFLIFSLSTCKSSLFAG